MEFKIGDKVRVRQDTGRDWPKDWQDTYVITAARLQYQGDGRINYSIATQGEIDRRVGDTDGFYDDHLVAA